jgi:4-amino-4-deoxy-L-arabinose transferase-like glycosyltransferase
MAKKANGSEAEKSFIGRNKIMAEKIYSAVRKWILENVDWKTVLFLFVIGLAIFLRVWHFHDWLFFKMDQARDAFTARQAFQNGPGWLPLLGPKAGGTNLNLGPVFYYFQYFSTVIFQSASPQVMAYPDLLFSILSIPLFYFLLKKYFSRDWSLVIASAYALCFLAIEYSRFAWNPNSLPFFNLLFIYSLLNVFDDTKKSRLRWVALAAFSFAVSTQLHFLSFLTLPLITLVFLLSERKEIGKHLDWKKILLFVAVIFFFYAPVLLHEIHTGGRNSQEFLAAIHSKASKHSLFDNIKKDVLYFGQNWLTILTGYITKSKNTPPFILTWIIFILPALFLNIFFFRREENEKKKKFLLVTFLWFVVYFLAYIPIAYDTRPRFFLPMIILPFIFAGYIAKYLLSLGSKNKRICIAAALALFAVIIGTNLYGTNLWFQEMEAAQKKGIYPKRTIILKARDGIVLWHLENSAKYITDHCPSEKIYFLSSSEYNRPMKYLIGLQGKKALALTDLQVGNADTCTFAVKRTRVESNKLGSDLDLEYSVVGEKKIGAWTVLNLKIKDNFLGQDLPSFHRGRQNSSESEDTKRVYWKDIFIPKN